MRRLRHCHFSARPPSMHASLDPVVEQPTVFHAPGACQRSAIMCTQRSSISAVCGYSSLSIMFLSSDSSISWRASGSDPGRAEGRQVLPRVAVQQQLIVHQAVYFLRRGCVIRQAVFRQVLVRGRRRVDVVGPEIAGSCYLVQWHVELLFLCVGSWPALISSGRRSPHVRAEGP